MTDKEIQALSLSLFKQHGDMIKARADENIEKYRKGVFKLKVTDQSGKPFCDKKVRITQKTHDFKYGANIFMLDQYDSAEDNKAFRDTFYQYFNLATVPFYWGDLEPEQGKPRYEKNSPNVYRRPSPDLCVEYCEEKGISPKLHCLFYDKFLPSWVPKNDEAEMMRLYEKRFQEIAERYSGKMYEFEVINEVLSYHQEVSVLSDRKDILDWTFGLAKKYLPNEKLVINDGNFVPHIGKPHVGYHHPYYMMIQSALQRGVPIGKVGVQNHIYCGCKSPANEALPHYMDYFNPERIIKGLDVLSDLGLPLEITETLIPTLGQGQWADDLQGELFKYLYTIWFSTPKMESIVYWNIIEGSAYSIPGWDENRCGGYIFKRDFTPKPAAKVVKDLFSKEWHTDLELTTDCNGEIDFKGFYGDYELTVDGEKVSFGIHKNGEKSLTVTKTEGRI